MYYAFLGHSPALSLAELQQLGLSPVSLSSQIASLGVDPTPLASRLAGTVKLGRAVATCSRETVITTLQELIARGTGKNYAVTDYASLNLSRSEMHSLKAEAGRSVRLVSLETTPHELVMLSRQHVTEYNLVKQGEELAIVETTWMQDGVAWSKRDRERPYQDIKRGLLPPKIARLMVNLATKGEGGVVLDPFCGTGTVLAEAMLLGNSVLGSDNDPAAITGAKQNLAWLQATYSLSASSYRLELSDATHVSAHFPHADYIVTEPYMGPLQDKRLALDADKVKNIARGLDKLYRGALRSWLPILPDHGRVAMILPEFHLGNRVISTTSVDTISALGYNTLRQVAYSKPGAVVVRNITLLEKK